MIESSPTSVGAPSAPAAHPPIRTPDQRLRVFVSSTLQELAEERQAARNAITRLRLSPVMFELGARPHPARELYRSYLSQSHVFVGIYWQRYGWVAPGETISGLEDEYRLSGDRPKLIYVKVPAPQREERLEQLLATIRSDDQVSYKPFASAAELQELLENDLALLLTERFEASEEPEAVPESRPAALPQPSSSFIGRRAILGELLELLRDPEVRLVTLHGPGGIGKSRLALEAARELEPEFADGVAFVPLAQLRDPGLVLQGIAAALQVRESNDRPLLDALCRALASRQMLLLLDNFEQVLDAASEVAELLSAAPGVKALVTSRTVLRLTGEHEFPVPPMALPDRSDALEPAAASEYGAIELFVERARAVKPDFRLQSDNARAVAEIARRLDGLPLAIELAAARVRLLPPQALLKRMGKALPLLTGGARDLPARQQTLRNTIDWSYDLLAPPEQELLLRLAVFEGSFDLDAVEAVCDLGDLGDTLERMLSLADKSLIRGAEGGSETRFAMLGTVREYALEKLEQRGSAELRRRHMAHYVRLAESMLPGMQGQGQRERLAVLDAEGPNLRAALNAAIELGEAEPALRLVVSLRWFWMVRGTFAEARGWATRALALPGEVPVALRAAALSAAGVLAWRQGDLAAAQPLLEESLLLARRAQDSYGVANALRILGILRHNAADYPEARRLLEESLDLMRAIGHQEGTANTLLSLGNVALDQGEAAASFYLESLAISEGIGDQLGVAQAVDNLGVAAWYHAELDESEQYSTEALGLYEAMGNRLGVANVCHRRGLLALARGQLAEARRHFEESLATKRELGDSRGVAFVLYDLGRVALREGDWTAAARYLADGLETSWQVRAPVIELLFFEGASALLAESDPAAAVRASALAASERERMGAPVAPVNRADHQALLERLRCALPPADFAEQWQAGGAQPLDAASEALHAVLGRLAAVAARPATVHHPASAG